MSLSLALRMPEKYLFLELASVIPLVCCIWII
jgi:hypothetical protein